MFTDIDNEQKLVIVLNTLLNKLDYGHKIREIINITVSIDICNNDAYNEYIDNEISTVMNSKQMLVPYVTQHVLGTGSFASVYKAQHKLDNEYYAVKRVIIDTDLYNGADDILHEIRILAKLTYHPNVIRYYNSWLDNVKLIMGDESDDEIPSNQLYLNIQLELCDYTLREYMFSYIYDVNAIDRVKLWTGLISAVKHLHDNNIIHRDIKPSNIFIKNGILKLGDFGLSRIYSDEQSYLVQKSIDIGCSYYRAPEIDSGIYNSTIDVYSSGIILLELLLNYNTMMEKDKLVKSMLKSGKIPQLLLDEYDVLISKMITSVNRINIYQVTELLSNKKIEDFSYIE